MAISWIASSTNGAASPVTVGIPAGVVADDLLYVAVQWLEATGTDPTVTDNDSGGNAWTKAGGDASKIATVWWKRATSGTASKTITVTASPAAYVILNYYRGGLLTGDPTSNLSVESNASGNETHAGFTPDRAGSMIAAVVSNGTAGDASASFACTDPGAFGAVSLTGGFRALTAHWALQAAGPTATGSFTWTQPNAATISIVWAIKALGASISPSASRSPSVSTSASSSPSRSPSVSTSASSSPSRSPSSSQSPSISVSASNSPSTSPSASISPSISVSRSVSRSVSASISPSSSRSPSASLSPGDYPGPAVYVSVAGVQRATDRSVTSARLLDDSLTVTLTLNEEPDRCAFSAQGFTPAVGDRVTVRLGGEDNPDKIFVGTIVTIQQSYIGSPANLVYHCDCIDETWAMDRRTVTRRYTATSATDIVLDLIETYAPADFTTTAVEADLAVLDEITFTNETLTRCLSRLAARVGGYWYCDQDKGIHFFTSETPWNPPTDLTAAHDSLTAFAITRDLTQVVTRVFVEGGGGNALADCDIQETIIPVTNAIWYSPLGGTVVSGPQRITYTGRDLGGAGSIVGPGTGPAAAPAATPVVAASGVDVGTHRYAVTFVTGSGESLPGPSVSAESHDAITAPVGAPGVTLAGPPGSLTGSFYYQYTFRRISDGAETTPSPANVGIGTSGAAYLLTQLAPCDAAPIGFTRRWYRRNSTAADTSFRALPTLVEYTPVAGYLHDPYADAELGAVVPTADGTQTRWCALTGIPIGAASVTSRNLYRTAANGSQLKLLATLGDNSTTTYTDALADATLGANVPTSDASGLTQPAGQVNAGSTALLVAGSGAFRSAGGWAVIGNGQQVIRYTSIAAGYLTGIPATGAGAIVASIAYNTTVTAAPQLTGIPTHATSPSISPSVSASASASSTASISASASISPSASLSASASLSPSISVSSSQSPSTSLSPSASTSMSPSTSLSPSRSASASTSPSVAPAESTIGDGSIQHLIHKGDPVNLWVQVDDTAAQYALALSIGGDGIQEYYLQDWRLSETEARDRGSAYLALHSSVDVGASLRYTTRDPHTRAGYDIVVNLPAPMSVSGTYKIQKVTITDFHPSLFPTYKAEASATRFSFEDLLRRARLEE